MLFPGLDLTTRCRYRWLPPLFKAGPIETLDVGFGNGAFSLAAARKGNRVTAISFDQGQVDKAKSFFGSDNERINFLCLNAYKLRDLGRQFDQIICLETLEHIRDDRGMVRLFYDLLRPGGTLQLCCPNRLGLLPLVRQAQRRFRKAEGFEVRYWSLNDLRALFEENFGVVSFEVDCFFGIGLQAADEKFMIPAMKCAVRVSELLRRMSHTVPLITHFADSVYVRAKKGCQPPTQ